MTTLQVTWFVLIGVLLTGYAILDGFDLGVGFWHLFAKKDKHRQILMKSIAPVWDGNEVWLITGGGAIFAAFPHVYATVFSGLYLALMLVLFGLIFRAVSFEFRNTEESPRWRMGWDFAFSLGSSIPAFLYGVAVGNILRGLPLDESMNFTGSFFSLLNPYALLVGLLGFVMFATHGAIYILLKTEGELFEKAKKWARISWGAYISLFIVASAVTIAEQPHLLANYSAFPTLWAIPVLTLTAICLTGFFVFKERFGMSFIFSAASIATIMLMCASSVFPAFVPALDAPELSLTIINSSSSELTLKTMLVFAIIGMPFVIGYTIWIYHAFRGKVSAVDKNY